MVHPTKDIPDELRSSIRPCPVCRSTAGRKLLFNQRFVSLDEVGLMNGYDVVVCQKCGAGFADHIPEQPVFDAYYQSQSKYENHKGDGQISASYAKAYQDIVDRVTECVPEKSARIIDVGCAAAGLLAEFKRRGFTNLLFIDPSPSCAAAALKHHDILVVTNTIAEMTADHHTFDLVLFTGVLEHVRDVYATLQQLDKLLAPGGSIAIVVPDVVSYRDSLNAPFQQFSVEHINYFSPHSLTNLMLDNGYKRNRLWQTFYDIGMNATESALLGVFNRMEVDQAPISFDHETETAIADYLARSQAIANQDDQRIESLVRSGQPLLVRGVGTLTQRLLATSTLAQANIVAFVDSNRNYQGKTLFGKPIWSPSNLPGFAEDILICSWQYQDEIVRQIRDDPHLPNRVFTLYQR